MPPEISRLVEAHLTELRDAGKSEATLVICETWLTRFVKRYAELGELNPAELTRYHQALQWEPGLRGKLYSENTVNQALGVIRPFLAWCVERGHLKTDPSAHLRTRRPPKKKRPMLSASQVRELLSMPDLSKPLGLRDRAVLGLFTELMPSAPAVARLNMTDFQPDTGALLLRGRGRRVVELSDGLITDIERYIKHGRQGYAKPGEQALFISKRGGRLEGPGVREIVNRYRRLASGPSSS